MIVFEDSIQERTRVKVVINMLLAVLIKLEVLSHDITDMKAWALHIGNIELLSFLSMKVFEPVFIRHMLKLLGFTAGHTSVILGEVLD